MHFGQKPRFELADDETITARAGTQMNCGGIASIRVRITRREAPGIGFSARVDADWDGGEYGPQVPGSAVPVLLRDAVYAGARRAYEKFGLTSGLKLELIDALVHEVDANPRMFLAAGKEAVSGWIRQNLS